MKTDLRHRYDRRLPRYTSYPTAPHFQELEPGVAEAALARCGQDVSLYVHVPFCKRLCWYCGCHTEIVSRRSALSVYVTGLLLELDLMIEHLPKRPHIWQLALGGGTPSALPPEDIIRLMQGLYKAGVFPSEGERAIEIDPRTVSLDHLDMLLDLGFNRFSFGVQDLDAAVMQAVNRPQPADIVEAVVARVVDRAPLGINIDLMYGLPEQTPESLAATVDRAVGMRPSRITLFPYAHTPWLKPAQRLLERSGLPDRDARLALWDTAAERLAGHGYERIGMDHFALPDDALVLARDAGTLHRNFQGYTTRPDLEMLALGVSSIGYYGGLYAQNHKERATWLADIRAGRLPVARGRELTEDDQLRRQIILDLLCRGTVRWEDLGGEPVWAAEVLDRLQPMVDDGLVQIDPSGVLITEAGRDFARNAAAAFDDYLQSNQVRYSRTI